MFVEGIVKTYNVKKGFGFIRVAGENKDIFFHITNCTNKHVEPKQGERFKFRVINENGKLKAENIVRLDLKLETERQTPQSRALSKERVAPRKTNTKHKSAGGFGFMIIGLLVIAGLGYAIYHKYQRSNLAAQTPNPIQTIVEPSKNANPNAYRCDGRIHCSDMNSREEARWFVRNCPGTKMDGNNDGEPCESDSRW